MSQRRFGWYAIVTLAFAVAVACSGQTHADDKQSTEEGAAAAETPGGSAGSSSSTGSSTEAKPATPAHAVLLKDAKSFSGLIPLYQKGDKLYAELSSSHYGNEYLVLISIARGIGQGMLLGGMTWGFGDDWVWKFRKIDDKVHIIRRNVRFKADKGSPEASAVVNAYTDSVLFSLPIVTKGPKGGDLIDLTSVFMSDLPQISQSLPGFMFSSSKSTWDNVKAFDNNVELQVAATYQSSGQMTFDTVADSRGVTIVVHYSISQIPSTGYKPRIADDRVGYFLTVVKDFSKRDPEDQFVRYINRWKLDKADSGAEASAPKEPLIFWIEKTVPFKYRKPIRDGILEWNRAFEQAGILDAIEVRQQPDDADWDPEDVNYNTFRWITSDAGFAMGPSRVNPYTGQILDADIIFDADFLAYWKQEFETFTPEDVAAMTGGSLERPAAALPPTGSRLFGLPSGAHACLLNRGMARQIAFGAAAIHGLAEPEKAAELKEEMIMQGLKQVAMHEVGHTLGLRHNFKGSTLRPLKEVNDTAKSRAEGMVASIMDYNPANIVPKGQDQGDYYPTTIGPYDFWAIEYGYRQFAGSEEEELKKLASRSGERALQFATDEDTNGWDPDPESNRFDLGENLLDYANQRAELMKQLIPGLVDRTVGEGEDYTKARKAFNVILAQYGQAMFYAARYVGGLHTSRSHKGDKDGRPPVAVVEPTRGREALALLEQNVLNDTPFQFPPELYNQLGMTNWKHWGLESTTQKDFPVHDFILMWQERILAQLLSSTTLSRIIDAELKVPADADALTTAELIQRLTDAVFAEVSSLKAGEYSTRKPAISSLRRNLQRSFLKQLSNLALGRTGAPQDCQTVAYAELASLRDDIQKLLDSKVKLDAYSQAHLLESSRRIEKVLEADLSLPGP